LASALSWAASCLSFSVISLESLKLRVDSAGDGMDEEGGVEESERDGEDGEDSLMLTINEHHLHSGCSPYSIRFTPGPGPVNKFKYIMRDILPSLNGTSPDCDICQVLFHKRSLPGTSHLRIDER
jgi:hypothetical protein